MASQASRVAVSANTSFGSTKMNRTKGAILVLACLNVALIFFCAAKSYESMKVSALYRSSRALAVSLPRFVLPDADGRQYASDDILMVEEYTLFVLLSPSDCSPCLAEINFWTQLALIRPRLHVCAIARHGNLVELRHWIRNLDVSFPVLCDEKGSVTSQMGVLSTPARCSRIAAAGFC